MEEQPIRQLEQHASPQIKPVAILLAFIALVIIGGGAGYYFYGPCGLVRFRDASSKLEGLMEKHLDLSTLASSTSRIALTVPVTQLQDLRRDIQDVPHPTCMQPAFDDLDKAMDFEISAYLGFMAQDPDTSVEVKMQTAGSYLQNATNHLSVLRMCAPLCSGNE